MWKTTLTLCISVSNCILPAHPFANCDSLFHPSSTGDSIPDYMTFVAYISSAMTRHQGLFGSAVDISVIHCQGEECWIKVHKEYSSFPELSNNSDKQKVWAALSCWTKDLDEGHRAISWEIVQISKSKDKIAEGIPGFPNQQAQ